MTWKIEHNPPPPPPIVKEGSGRKPSALLIAFDNMPIGSAIADLTGVQAMQVSQHARLHGRSAPIKQSCDGTYRVWKLEKPDG